MGRGADAQVEPQLVAADQTAGRVQEVDVADVAPLGKERALNDEGPAVRATGEPGRAAVGREPQLERRAPSHRSRRYAAPAGSTQVLGSCQMTSTTHPSGLSTVWLEPGGLTTCEPAG